MRKCSACRRHVDCQPVTVGLSLEFDGPWRLRQYIYICSDCHRRLDEQDEVIGPTLEAAVCTMLRALGRKRR